MLTPDADLTAPRALLCHKQKTSARLHFLRFAHGMLTFAPLPRGMKTFAETASNTIRMHPTAWTSHIESRLGLAPHSLSVETDFHAEARDGQTHIPLMLACFTSLDLPRDIAPGLGATWIPITAAQDLPPAELELLRLAYEHLIG